MEDSNISFLPPHRIQDNEEHCRQVYEKITGGKFEELKFLPDTEELVILSGRNKKGQLCNVNIWEDGDVFYYVNQVQEPFNNPFIIVDALRSRGYSA